MKANETVREARAETGAYLRFYNTEQPRQALDYRTPAEVYATDKDDSAWMDRRTLPGTLVGYKPLQDSHLSRQ